MILLSIGSLKLPDSTVIELYQWRDEYNRLSYRVDSENPCRAFLTLPAAYEEFVRCCNAAATQTGLIE